jgi:hypothetical protein
MLAAGLSGCPTSNKDASTKAILQAVVDFEGITPGTIVSSLTNGAGISGPILGSVGVLGHTPSLGAANSAVIFDSANPNFEDPDLGTPNEIHGGLGVGSGGASNAVPLGNILIIDESLEDTNPADGLVDVPDDTFESGSTLTFDFTTLAGGVVRVVQMTVIDVEENEGGAFVEVSGPALPPTQIPIPFTGDNGAATFAINADGVSSMLVTFNGSGAVGEFLIEQDMPEDGGFRTQTQGGWGTRCRGHNPGCYRDANFDSCFPQGLLAGCEPGNSILLTSSEAVKEFLPQGGSPAALAQDHTDPDGRIGVLAGQVVALTLNVQFDLCDPNFGESGTNLANLVVIEDERECYGMTVQQVLDLANAILGGCSTALTPSQINDCVTKINENYVDGEQDNGFLG